MGHTQSDLDAFGSMIAVHHMAKASKKQALMIVEEPKLDLTTQKILSILKEQIPHFYDSCVLPEEAIRQMNENSLLIIVDSQSPKIVMSPEVLSKAQKTIIIDHHRVGEDTFDADFSFIEPYASSTIELVMELLNFYNLEEEISISSLEATVMYGGLIVDTNNFFISDKFKNV